MIFNKIKKSIVSILLITILCVNVFACITFGAIGYDDNDLPSVKFSDLKERLAREQAIRAKNETTANPINPIGEEAYVTKEENDGTNEKEYKISADDEQKLVIATKNRLNAESAIDRLLAEALRQLTVRSNELIEDCYNEVLAGVNVNTMDYANKYTEIIGVYRRRIYKLFSSIVQKYGISNEKMIEKFTSVESQLLAKDNEFRKLLGLQK